MHPLILLLIIFFVLLVIRVPIAFAIGLSAIGTILYIDLPFTTIINQMFDGLDSFPLLAVPLFLLVGKLMNDGGITDRLVAFASTIVGHIKGGLGHINVAVSMLFAGLSGSAAADAAAIGGMMIPAMKKAKFDAGFSVAITAASATLGVIIPPSIMMVVYGAMGQISIGALFLAGIVPGVMIGLIQMAYTYFMAVKHDYPAQPRAKAKDVGGSFLKTFPALLLPLFILGGITSGIFTATEAAAVAVVYGLILMAFYRTLNPRKLIQTFAESVVDFSLPMMAVASAGIMGWLIAFLHGPEMIADFIMGITSSYFGVFLLLIAFLLVIGTFMSPIPAIIIFLPIIQGLGEAAGINEVQLGVIVCLSLALGMVTPPYGIALLISAQIGKITTLRAFVSTIPIIGLMLLVILSGVIIPDLFLFLPKMIMPDVM